MSRLEDRISCVRSASQGPEFPLDDYFLLRLCWEIQKINKKIHGTSRALNYVGTTARIGQLTNTFLRS
jgi:hypothetical protein